MSEILDVQVNPHQALNKGEKDFNFFAGLCLPTIIRFAFPDYYIAVWLLLVNAIETGQKDKIKKLLRHVIGLPRGFAKTTFLKILIVWLIVYDKVSFVLIVCATGPLAESFLSDVHNILQSSNIERVYGRWDPAVDQVSTKRGSYHRRPLVMKAAGSGGSVRGINEENMRPDFIICDDMQTKENDNSDTERAALFDWFVGTLLKTVDQFFATVMYVGNMYSDHCILYQLKINPHWTSLITGAILEDGTSLWPQLFTIEDLYDSFLHDESLGKADIWFAEIMNDPIDSLTTLLPNPLPTDILTVIPSPDAAFVTIDPAGYRDAADDNVVAAHYIIDGKGYIAEMDGGIWNPGQTAECAIIQAVTHNATLIAVEKYVYQASLAYWINRLMHEEGITGIEAVPIARLQNKTKEQHIRAFITELYSRNYAFIRQKDRSKFVYQALAYRLGKKKNKDDWLDCPAMGLEVRNQFIHLLGVRSNVVPGSSARVRGNNTPF